MNFEEIQQISEWYESGKLTTFVQGNFCHTRSEFNGRLISYQNILSKKLSDQCMHLLISSIGEVGNNCFDHNLGHWQGPSGCVFIREEQLCLVADRGQGIKGSLSKVYHLQKDDKSFLTVAYEKRISGRTPEKRGNGLKFTKKNILNCHFNLFCTSNSETIFFGNFGKEALNPFKNFTFKNSGTMTLIYW